jgi:hypothetical protein
MSAAANVPRIVSQFAATMARMSGVEPTVTAQPGRRWLVEFRTDRVYGTARFVENRRTGRYQLDNSGVLEVDGEPVDVLDEDEFAEVLRYPDGKPMAVPPTPELVDPADVPPRVRHEYEKIRRQAPNGVTVWLGREQRRYVLGLDKGDTSAIRMSFQRVGTAWETSDLVVIAHGVDRTRQVAHQGIGAAVAALMAPPPATPSPGPVAGPAGPKTDTGVQVRKTNVLRL